MEYHEAASLLFDLQRFRPKPGTERTAALLADLGVDAGSLRCVQVAGSNGKGSTARMLERSLREAGLSVGLYTQPHLEDVRERVRVDGRKLRKADLAAFVAAAEPTLTERAAEGTAPTFFETVTAMALWAFQRADVDVAVLEVGIGGRYDATSVVDPVASAVTSVTLEHTGIIGETIAEIARDKAHVAPEGQPLVTGATGEALAAVREQAGEVVTVGEADADVTTTYGGRVNHAEAAVEVDATDWAVETHLPTIGRHQAVNSGIAATLARQVADVDTASLEQGIRAAHWPGRFEVVDREPTVVLDGAHNPGAAAALADAIGEYDYDALRLVVGANHDKDHRGIAAALPRADGVATAAANVDGAEDPGVLARVFEEAGAGDVSTHPTVRRALSATLSDAGHDDLVVVTGSLYAVAEARRRWSRTTVPKGIDDGGRIRRAVDGTGVPADRRAALADAGSARVLKTRLREEEARRLQSALRAVGGECGIAPLGTEAQLVDALPMGSVAAFGRLADRLADGPGDLAALSADLAAAPPEPAVDPALPWADGTAVMGILNVTPDSFHDGGEYDAPEAAVERAAAMIEAGADVIDVGGESTRPGADPVPVDEELDRVVPVIERLADRGTTVSVDTRKADVAEAALAAGADVINDVSGLGDPAMRFVAAEHEAPVVLMHSVRTPVDPDTTPAYDDVVEDVIEELHERVLLAEQAGLDRGQILVDPGLGFGKTAAESFALLERLGEFRALGCPIVVGHSHKSMFERVGAAHGERLQPTVAATALAVDRGADVVRVHDVAENEAAVRVARALDGTDAPDTGGEPPR